MSRTFMATIPENMKREKLWTSVKLCPGHAGRALIERFNIFNQDILSDQHYVEEPKT
jgi:hypothetical protein